MSLVCFPFKQEHLPTILRNIKIAAEHPDVSLVLLSSACENSCHAQVSAAIDEVSESDNPYPVPVVTIVQSRLGSLRPGKGDGMNSAMNYFLSAHELPELQLEQPLARLHFYDADIESFDADWITKAEAGMSDGYDLVRHYFARSSTDAQVTWQVTKVGFALLWPSSTLPLVQQPLGGELCFSRRVVQALMADARVVRQSDWGIDTLYTFVCAQNGFSVLEAYMPQGKMHALYNGLADLKTMLCECFGAVQSLRGEDVTVPPNVHCIEPAGPVSRLIAQKIGYDVQKTLKLLRENWTERQVELLGCFSEEVRGGMLSAREWPEYMFMSEEAWIGAYQVCLEKFELGDEDWREVLFKMWVCRVLNYTMRHVVRGYSVALGENAEMVQKLHGQRLLKGLKAYEFGENLEKVGSSMSIVDQSDENSGDDGKLDAATLTDPTAATRTELTPPGVFETVKHRLRRWSQQISNVGMYTFMGR